MKHFILTLILAFVSIFAVNANTVNTVEPIKFNKVMVEAPCRIVYGIADTTAIRISNKSAFYDVYYEIKNDVLYIKTNELLDNIMDSEKNPDNIVPIIRILHKDVLPEIQTRSSLQICERSKRSSKTLSKKENGTTELAKN